MTEFTFPIRVYEGGFTRSQLKHQGLQEITVSRDSDAFAMAPAVNSPVPGGSGHTNVRYRMTSARPPSDYFSLIPGYPPQAPPAYGHPSGGPSAYGYPSAAPAYDYPSGGQPSSGYPSRGSSAYDYPSGAPSSGYAPRGSGASRGPDYYSYR